MRLHAISKRGEEREWRRLKSQRPSEKKTGIGWRGLPRYRRSWEDMRSLGGNQVLRRGVCSSGNTSKGRLDFSPAAR